MYTVPEDRFQCGFLCDRLVSSWQGFAPLFSETSETRSRVHPKRSQQLGLFGRMVLGGWLGWERTRWVGNAPKAVGAA